MPVTEIYSTTHYAMFMLYVRNIHITALKYNVVDSLKF